MMFLRALALLLALSGSALAQSGQIPSGTVWGNPGASKAIATSATVTAILDRALGSTRGSIIERGASGWALIGPGATVGLPFVSNGTGADPGYTSSLSMPNITATTALSSPTITGTTSISSPAITATTSVTSPTYNATGGTAFIGSGSNTGFELGSQAGVNTPFIDFHSSGNVIDYDSRIVASGGTGVAGNGTITLTAAVVRAPTPATGDSSTNVATTAFVTAAYQPPPQGRLTLQTATPVMTTTQGSKTTLFYTPYKGNRIPIYDGASMLPTVFSELSVLTTDTTKSPAAIGASKVNDWFVWSDSGTIRLGHGPDWTSDTARSAGTALVMVNGILLNNASITNGPAASRGTYVGTTRSDGSSALDFILGGTASGGTSGFLGVWNAYNRTKSVASSVDGAAGYTYSSNTVRQANASTGNQVTFVVGLSEDAVEAFYQTRVDTAAVSGAFGAVGIGVDTTSAFTSPRLFSATVAAVSMIGSPAPSYAALSAIGKHVWSANEQGDGTNNATFDAQSSNTLMVSVWN